MRYYKFEVRDNNIILTDCITAEEYNSLDWFGKSDYTNDIELSKINPNRILSLVDEKDLN